MQLSFILRALKAMKSQSSSAHLLKLEMVKGENVVEIDGTVTTQPVLQHIGVSTWPGKCQHNSIIIQLYGLITDHIC